MKAVMDEGGVITLSPETGTEAYALKAWVSKNHMTVNDLARRESVYWLGSGLLVVSAVVKEPSEPQK